MSSNNKIAVVTGAGTGIGRAAALALLQAGYSVVLAGRRREPLEQVAAESKAGDRALVLPTDVADAAQVDALFAAARSRFGRVDVLFNNAGINAPSIAFEDLSLQTWKSVVDINLTGMFLCAQAAFRVMKDQQPRGGRIINNGSISAHAPRPDSAPYTCTKHAVTGLTKCISLDGRKYDIACGQVDVGNAMTELAQRMSKGVKQANGEIAIEAMMDVSEVASTILHMVSLPLATNIQFVTVMASKMPFVGRG